MSDIDIVVIVKDAKIKSKGEILFEKIDREISVRFGNSLSPYINTRAEFKSKYGKKMAVIKNILKEHKMIYGEDLREST
jgi:predicted nucleotidyltransferase